MFGVDKATKMWVKDGCNRVRTIKKTVDQDEMKRSQEKQAN